MEGMANLSNDGLLNKELSLPYAAF